MCFQRQFLQKMWPIQLNFLRVYCTVHKMFLPSFTLCNTSFLTRSGQVISILLRECADMSLARPGMKQATATKLGIYSTYSPWSSIHVLARCFNFCKPHKKIQKFVPPTRFPRQQWPLRRTKNGELSIVFSVQGTGGRPTEPDPENRAGGQDIGSTGRPVSSRLQVHGESGHCRVRTRPPWCNSRGPFPSKCPSIAPAEISNTPPW